MADLTYNINIKNYTHPEYGQGSISEMCSTGGLSAEQATTELLDIIDRIQQLTPTSDLVIDAIITKWAQKHLLVRRSKLMADYILNKTTNVVHDTKRMSEICNVDDIEDKEQLALDEFLDLVCVGKVRCCLHCWPD